MLGYDLVFKEEATALGRSPFFRDSNELIWGDVRLLRSIDSNLLDSVEKTEGWKETKCGFVPAFEARETSLEVV